MLTLSFFSKLVTINGDWSLSSLLALHLNKQKAVVRKLDIKFFELSCSEHNQKVFSLLRCNPQVSIRETDFNFNFIKNKLSIHIAQDVPMIFVYPFLELPGVNKHLPIKLRKTGTVFQLI